ncbi:unnamed protein product, partial [Sphacelaria rigidula]
LHRPVEDTPGPAERAGVAIGDVILGINYVPLERGLVNTAAQLAEAIACAGFVKLQISRQVKGDSRRRQGLPGRDCLVVTDLMWRTAHLRRAGILTSSERHAIAGMILQLMAWDEGTAAPLPPSLIMFPLSLSTMEAPFAAARSKGNSTTNGGGSGVRSSSLKQQPAAALAGVSLARW